MLGEDPGEDVPEAFRPIRSPSDIYVDTGEYVYSNCFEESSTCLFSSSLILNTATGKGELSA